jgi:hypothetical protein
MQPVHREVKAISVLVLKKEEVVGQAGHGEVDEALVDTDAVIHMDDEISRVEVAQGIKQGPGGGVTLASSPGFVAIQLGLGHHREELVGPDEAPGKVADQDLGNRCLHGEAAEGFGAEHAVDAVIGEKVLEAAALVRRATDQERAQPGPLPFLEPEREGLQEPLPVRIGEYFLPEFLVIAHAELKHPARRVLAMLGQ